MLPQRLRWVLDQAFGHDSLMNHWSLFGSGDAYQKLNYFVQRFGYTDEWHLGQSLKYATGGLTPLTEEGCMQWPKVGDRANAILVDAVSSAYLIARKCPISTVIAQGVVVHQVEMVQKGHCDEYMVNKCPIRSQRASVSSV